MYISSQNNMFTIKEGCLPKEKEEVETYIQRQLSLRYKKFYFLEYSLL